MADIKLDILVMAAHPDDAELAASGTIAKHVAQGYKVGVVDFTKGELGTRGTPELRMEEAAASSAILGLSARENMGFRDGFFQNDEAHQLALSRVIRKYKPTIVIANAPSDRHPDHGKGSALAKDACFISGLRMVKTELDGKDQQAHRPDKLFFYIQNNYLEPDFVVDVSEYWDMRMQSVRAFKSQFYNPESDEPSSFISSEGFMKFIDARGREMGHKIGAAYGEGFIKDQMLNVDDMLNI